MRLVGATRWYTQLPFLLEAVTAGIVGTLLGILLIAVLNAFFLGDALSGLISSGIVGRITAVDLLFVSPWLLLTAIGISAITGYVTLRLYVRT